MLLPAGHGLAGSALCRAGWLADSGRLLHGSAELNATLLMFGQFFDRFVVFFGGATNRPVGRPAARLNYFVHYQLQ